MSALLHRPREILQRLLGGCIVSHVCDCNRHLAQFFLLIGQQKILQFRHDRRDRDQAVANPLVGQADDGKRLNSTETLRVAPPLMSARPLWKLGRARSAGFALLI